MSESNTEADSPESGVGIDDESLPEDLQPSEDNPLAAGLDDGESVEGLLDDGKGAEESGEDSDDGDQGDQGDQADSEDSGAS